MASGGWGGMGAWSAPKQQPQTEWQTAGDGGLIRASGTELSEVNLNQPTTGPTAPAAAVPTASKPTSAFGNMFNKSAATVPQPAPTQPPPAANVGTLNMSKPTVNVYSASNTNDLAAREAALARKEAELVAREKDLGSREAELRRAGALAPRKNWPMCFPLIHHDIAGDIPKESQGQVRLAYWCYLGLVLCLVFNFVGACAMVALKAPDRMSSWFLATIYCIAGIPLAMVIWYNKLYNTIQHNGSLGYLGFFIGFVIHTAFCIWAAIAVPLAGERWSFTGWVAALRAFDVSATGGVIYIIGSSLWTLEALASFWCLKTVYFSFRSGGKKQEVQGELAKVALKTAMASDNKV